MKTQRLIDMKQVRAATVLLVTCAGLGLAACGNGGEEKAADVSELIMQSGDLAIARDTTVADAVILTGTLEPYRVVEVRAQVPGTLSALRVDRGDRVSNGTVMAVLNAAGIRSAADAAKAGVAAAQGGEALARRQLESARRLHDTGALSAIELQGAQAAYDAAAGQLAAARAQLAGAAEAAGYASVLAPFAGIVSTRDVNIGEAVNPGQTLFTVVDPSTLELAGEVPIEAAARLRPGARVTFTVDAYPGEQFSGAVARIEPVADAATRRVGVYLRLANGSGRLYGGVFATGRIDVGAAVRGVTVPLAALRGARDSVYVWVVSNGVPSRRPVQLIYRDDVTAQVQLRGKLSPGDTVIIAPGEVTEGVKLVVAKQQANAGVPQ